jgi:hypothetical protein
MAGISSVPSLKLSQHSVSIRKQPPTRLTAAFTLDQYAHVTETMKRDSSNRMDAFIRGLDIDDQENVKGKIKGNPILKGKKCPCNR